mmetsp:Transcript_27424/g.87882  ORF Transcript_27424/g.87882 Transcript_27424/m.87882 type:complete len:247 (-) Transcript_27424:152-892(-)
MPIHAARLVGPLLHAPPLRVPLPPLLLPLAALAVPRPLVSGALDGRRALLIIPPPRHFLPHLPPRVTIHIEAALLGSEFLVPRTVRLLPPRLLPFHVAIGGSPAHDGPRAPVAPTVATVLPALHPPGGAILEGSLRGLVCDDDTPVPLPRDAGPSSRWTARANSVDDGLRAPPASRRLITSREARERPNPGATAPSTSIDRSPPGQLPSRWGGPLRLPPCPEGCAVIPRRRMRHAEIVRPPISHPP